jgi:polyhydroxyalkanoate synthesis repressor PhaR
MNDTIEITRYPNRRLYDRSRKAYVTLGDVETMVVGGQDIRVRDSKSDEDLTRVILTQIILERHPERMKMFPIAFLHNMLRADQISLNWMAAYLGKAKSVMDAFPGAMGTGAVGANLVPGVKFWQSLVSGPANSEATSQPTLDQPDHDGGGQPPLSPQQSSQLDMAEKLAEMEQRLQQLEGGSNEDEANA